MMTDKQYYHIREMIATVKIICIIHDHVKPHMWEDLAADMKNLGEFFEAKQRSENHDILLHGSCEDLRKQYRGRVTCKGHSRG